MKSLKPVNNSSRNTTLINYKEELVASAIKRTPRKLMKSLKNNSGRNNLGRITTRHKGGRSRRIYRIIDFKRKKNNVEGTVKSIEYDPNRTCFISLISYRDGDFSFILSPEGIKVGDKIISGDNDKISISLGNSLPLSLIPNNTQIHNLEMKPGKGGQIVKSAGSFAEIIGKDEGGKYILVKLPSKEVRKFLPNCRATIGRLGNVQNNLVRLGKAGRNIWRGVRPSVRGVAMNPVDHPHGGGEGKAPIGRKSPMSPWGKKTLGKKTRKIKKQSNRLIVSRRTKRKK